MWFRNNDYVVYAFVVCAKSTMTNCFVTLFRLDVVCSTGNLSSTINCYKETVGHFTHIFFAPGCRAVPRRGAYSDPQPPTGQPFDVATALHLPFRHLAINVATAVQRWRHLRENCSVKIASKNRTCDEMRKYL